jgi:hypothetical protein
MKRVSQRPQVLSEIGWYLHFIIINFLIAFRNHACGHGLLSENHSVMALVVFDKIAQLIKVSQKSFIPMLHKTSLELRKKITRSGPSENTHLFL